MIGVPVKDDEGQRRTRTDNTRDVHCMNRCSRVTPLLRNTHVCVYIYIYIYTQVSIIACIHAYVYIKHPYLF